MSFVSIFDHQSQSLTKTPFFFPTDTASRMESNSEVGRVTVSDAASALLRQQAPRAVLLPRGAVPIKGKGVLTLWWLHAAPP